MLLSSVEIDNFSLIPLCNLRLVDVLIPILLSIYSGFLKKLLSKETALFLWIVYSRTIPTVHSCNLYIYHFPASVIVVLKRQIKQINQSNFIAVMLRLISGDVIRIYNVPTLCWERHSILMKFRVHPLFSFENYELEVVFVNSSREVLNKKVVKISS